jgi:hypothetical protein
MVNLFGIIGFLLAINCIAFCDVLPLNFVDYRSVVVEYVTWAACNSEMYFELCALPQWLNWAILIHQNLCAKKILVKKCKDERQFFEI